MAGLGSRSAAEEASPKVRKGADPTHHAKRPRREPGPLLISFPFQGHGVASLNGCGPCPSRTAWAGFRTCALVGGMKVSIPVCLRIHPNSYLR